MSVFISYARTDKPVVELLRSDLDRARCDPWLDEELTGGEAWWSAILEQIRGCDLFVFALSPDSLRSKACQAELSYAIALQRPLLPVMVREVSVQLAPAPIANAQIIDFTERTPDSAIALVTAATGRSAPGGLPEPLPPAPPPPLSYMNPLREKIFANDLTFREQSQVVLELRGHLDDDDERIIATQLLQSLRSRRDIVESIGREIDELLADTPHSDTPQTGTPQTGQSQTGPTPGGPSGGGAGQATPTPPAGWHRDPLGRHEQRYWDGARWTDHVADRGERGTDPMPDARSTTSSTRGAGPTSGPGSAPGPGSASGVVASGVVASGAGGSWAGPTPGSGPMAGGGAAAGASNKIGDGAFIALIVATLFVGIVGIIAGAVNFKNPARKGQAQVLLWLGVASIIIGLLVINSGG